MNSMPQFTIQQYKTALLTNYDDIRRLFDEYVTDEIALIDQLVNAVREHESPCMIQQLADHLQYIQWRLPADALHTVEYCALEAVNECLFERVCTTCSEVCSDVSSVVLGEYIDQLYSDDPYDMDEYE